MAKKLNLKVMKKAVKHLDEKQRVVVDVDDKGEEVVVYIYPNFSNQRMDSFLKDMMTDEQKAMEKGIDFGKINRGNWVMFNIIKNFSDMENDIPEDIKNKVQYFNIFIETPYFAKVAASFPEESMKKLEQAMTDVMKQVDKLTEDQIKEMEKELREISEQLEAFEDDNDEEENKDEE